jgi:hypothetical protein
VRLCLVRHASAATGAPEGLMGTFTLVIWTSWVAWTTTEIRQPGLSEIECNLQAADVKWPKRARCELEKRQERLQVTPPEPPKGYTGYVICPTWGLCWRDGKPIRGAL